MTRHLPLIGMNPDPAALDEATPAPPLPLLPLRPVRRLPQPPDLNLFAKAGLPLVIEGALNDWPAVGCWTPSYLLEHAANLTTQAYVLPGGHVRLNDATGFELKTVRLGDYAAKIIAGEPTESYLRAPVGRLPSALQRELGEPRYCRGRLRLKKNLWFSAAGSVTQLHFDLPHNLIAQLSGTKRFILYPARERKNLYPFSVRSSVPHLSQVDLTAPDFRRFPRLPLAQGFHCELRSGDLLFMPSRMWHFAHSLSASVGVNFWWPPAWVMPLSIASDAYKRLRGLNI